MSNLIGQSLGRYHILEQLGEGGMATVYKAYDTRLERDVAVKIIRKSAFSAEVLERMLKRFEREAKALSKLTHPNIVGVIDYGDYEGSPYIVMEYLPGGTLKHQLGKPIPWQEAARILLPIARALDYAHQRGIVHRDVKPSNILITDSGEPMLSDFGIAKILESEETQTLTGTGVGVGTPEYMAPEQWTGKVTPQSDIYSLGVVFYEMVTGRKPYTADTPAAILLKQASEALPRPKQFVPDLPEAVERTLLKVLAKKPEDRYPDMTTFADRLDNLLAGQSKIRQPVITTNTFRPKAKPVPDTQATALQEDTYTTMLQDATPVIQSKPSAIPAIQQRKERFIQKTEWFMIFRWVLPAIVGVSIMSYAIWGTPYWGTPYPYTVFYWIGGWATIGVGQWLVLRRQIRKAGWWIFASLVGGLIMLLSVLMSIDAPGWALGSAVVGVGQWLVLRWQIRKAGWWVLATVLGWSIGLAAAIVVEQISFVWLVEGAIIGALVGVVTGLVLIRLLRQHPNRPSA